MTSVDSKTSLPTVDLEWDCVVIGAGPAGALAARRCAQLGLSTLVVERKSFPRAKVCGACLNHRAIAVLQSAGLGDITQADGGLPIDRFWLRGYAREFERELPHGVALSRSRLDSALVQSAIEAGATFLPQTSARVLPAAEQDTYRTVHLTDVKQTPGGDVDQQGSDVQAKVVIAADGLGHPSLRMLAEFGEQVASRSRVGIGAVASEFDAGWLRAGTIHMAVGRDGYAGMVLVEDGQLNVAAAVSPAFLKDQGSPQAAFQSILSESGFPEVSIARSRWMGTPALSRSTHCVAHHRVFVVGDAAGYVEPFTGEGMTWALSGGQAIAEFAALAVSDDALQAARLWQRTWGKLIYRRQRWCRRLAWLLRHPRMASFGVSAFARYPSMTNPIVSQMNLVPITQHSVDHEL